MLIFGGTALVGVCVFLNSINLNLFPYLPAALFSFLLVRYKDLYKLSLGVLKNLKKKIEPETGANLT